MKVSELMDILGELDQDLKVYIYQESYGWDELDKWSVEIRRGRVEIG